MSRDSPDPLTLPTTSSSSSCSQPPATASFVMPMGSAGLDPTQGFTFAKAPARSALGGRGQGGGTSGGREGAGGARMDREGEEGAGGSQGGLPSHQHHVDIEEETDDEGDGVVLAGSSAPHFQPPHRTANKPIPRPPFQLRQSSALNEFRFNPVPPHQQPPPSSHQQQQQERPKVPFGSVGTSAPRPFLVGVGGGAATPSSQVTSKAPQPRTPFHPSVSHDPAKQLPQQQQQQQQQQQPPPVSAKPAQPPPPASASAGGTHTSTSLKKRARTNETGVAFPAASGSTSTSGKQRTLSGSKTVSSPIKKAPSLRTASGEQGAGAGSGAPAGKRRKSEGSTPSSSAGMHDLGDFVAQLTRWDAEKQAKDNEIRQLRAQLVDKTTENQRLVADKNKLKTDLANRVKQALQQSSAAVENLKASETGVRTAFQTLKSEIGAASAASLREELVGIKEQYVNMFLDDSHEVCLERNEETKVAVLKDLTAELLNRQGVIDLLRAQLDTKTGDLAETHSKNDELLRRVEVLETANTTLQGEYDKLRREAVEEKVEFAGRLDEAAVKACERVEEAEKSGRERVEEVEKVGREKVEAAEEREKSAREEVEKVREKLEKEREGRAREVAESRTREGDLRHQVEEAQRMMRSKDVEVDEMRERCETLEQQQATLRADLVLAEQTASTLRTAAASHAESQARLVKDLRQSRDEQDAIKSQLSQALSELEALQRTATAASSELEESKEAVRDLQAVLAERDASLEAARSKREQLERDLENSERTLAALKQRPASPEANSVAQAEEVAQLRQQVEQLRSSLESVEREKAALGSEKEKLEGALRVAQDQQQAFTSERTRLTTSISTLELSLSAAQSTLATEQALVAQIQVDLDAARAAESGHAERLKKLEERLGEEKNRAVSIAVGSCREASARELMQKSNELKRANNKLEESNKKLVRVSNELAKARGGPVLNQHIASSSDSLPTQPNGDSAAKPRTALYNGNGRPPPARPALAGDEDPSSDLTAVEDLESQLEPVKSKAKAVKFASNPTTATTSSTSPEKLKRRPSAGVKVPTTKKPDVSTSASTTNTSTSSKKRPASAVVAFDAQMYGDGAHVEEEQDKEMELGREGGGKEDKEDEIEQSATPFVQKSKARTTYSSKKRR